MLISFQIRAINISRKHKSKTLNHSPPLSFPLLWTISNLYFMDSYLIGLPVVSYRSPSIKSLSLSLSPPSPLSLNNLNYFYSIALFLFSYFSISFSFMLEKFTFTNKQCCSTTNNYTQNKRVHLYIRPLPIPQKLHIL